MEQTPHCQLRTPPWVTTVLTVRGCQAHSWSSQRHADDAVTSTVDKYFAPMAVEADLETYPNYTRQRGGCGECSEASSNVL